LQVIGGATLSAESITIAAGSDSGSVELTATEDDDFDDETLTVIASGAVSDTIEITVTDTDEEPVAVPLVTAKSDEVEAAVAAAVDAVRDAAGLWLPGSDAAGYVSAHVPLSDLFDVAEGVTLTGIAEADHDVVGSWVNIDVENPMYNHVGLNPHGPGTATVVVNLTASEPGTDNANIATIEFDVTVDTPPLPDYTVSVAAAPMEIDEGGTSMITATASRMIDAEDGTVTVGGATREGTDRAVQMIRDLTGDVEIGRKVLGKVMRIMNFGAFVEILPGKEGLVPINELAEEPVSSVTDVVAEGDDIMVMVVEVDHLGRINLSRRAVLQELTPAETLASAPPRPGRDGPRGGGRRDGPGGRGGGRRPQRGGRRFD
jgi:hypothetical protein